MLSPIEVVPLAAAGPVLVDVRTEALKSTDPLALYRDVQLLTPDCYLFESLAGPAEDLNTAVVGWGRLAEVRIHPGTVGGFIELIGTGPLTEAIGTTLDRILGADRQITEADQIWRALRAITALFTVHTDIPTSTFAFGFLTALGYSAAWDIEELPERTLPPVGPGYALTLFQRTAWYDLHTGTAELLTATGPLLPEPPSVPVPPGTTGTTGRNGPGDPGDPGAAVPAAPAPTAIRDSLTAAAFERQVERCLDHIGVGDIYQIQIGHRIDVDTALSPLEVYLRLRDRSPAPYMYLIPWAGRTVVGASPELYLRVTDGSLMMRPIAGTAPGGGSVPAETSLADLRDNAKQQAEHVMLVDLCRNDIGRVCRPGTLTVDSFMRAEPFGYVNHLVSTVSGRLQDEIDIWDVVRATFPAGTMTGAPKIRAMELIHGIENAPRGLYAGAVGLIDLRGHAVLALCIRTAVHHEGRFSIQASAGVVADSTPAQEWDETLAKLSATYWALTGQEIPR